MSGGEGRRTDEEGKLVVATESSNVRKGEAPEAGGGVLERRKLRGGSKRLEVDAPSTNGGVGEYLGQEQTLALW